MSDFDLKILETCPVSYRCYCSRERVERALISLGRDELEQMLAEQGGCQLTCQFCDAVYDFSAEDLKRPAEKYVRKRTKIFEKFLLTDADGIRYNMPCRFEATGTGA